MLKNSSWEWKKISKDFLHKNFQIVNKINVLKTKKNNFMKLKSHPYSLDNNNDKSYLKTTLSLSRKIHTA